ncbi:hypothetical protein GGX14DRAFT_389713 [Mycena pura]|uniref:Uncharacterized protein n=1 Tax=Mycena pura TaxID=153505 RepID=A0AAD6VS51_9AGAR|nr:hypothetical protein GGX14DRAFT_389713 [Mycena pura]
MYTEERHGTPVKHGRDKVIGGHEDNVIYASTLAHIGDGYNYHHFGLIASPNHHSADAVASLVPTVTWYKNRIYGILATMHRMAQQQQINPANRGFVDKYLSSTAMTKVERLLRATRSATSMIINPQLKRIAEEFRALEEHDLCGEFEKLYQFYELDDVQSVLLITRGRRIERYIFPLLYLLLKRHLDILRLASCNVPDEYDFDAMSKSLFTIFQAVDDRIQSLEERDLCLVQK